VGLTACGRACGEAFLLTWEANDNCLTASRLPCEPPGTRLFAPPQTLLSAARFFRMCSALPSENLVAEWALTTLSRLPTWSLRVHATTHASNTSAQTTPLTRISPRCTLLLHPHACLHLSLTSIHSVVLLRPTGTWIFRRLPHGQCARHSSPRLPLWCVRVCSCVVCVCLRVAPERAYVSALRALFLLGHSQLLIVTIYQCMSLLLCSALFAPRAAHQQHTTLAASPELHSCVGISQSSTRVLVQFMD
jgi:hypothetical protein